MREFAKKALSQIKFCYLGDARNNMANSLLSGSAIMGMDFRIAAPPEYTPSAQLREQCEQISQKSGAKILVTSNIEKAVENCDFLYTDVWVSMGEPKELWAERISKLMPYSVIDKVLEMTNNPDVKFLHCLPAFHNRFTQVGEDIFRNFGIESMEVTDDVFEGDASVVFEQAENRLHTIKAVMVATLT
jgi:ornithine carbamoyltransferase